MEKTILTEKGALWLDPNKTSPYEFYQYWRNVEDESVKTVMQMLTFLPDEKIEELASYKTEKGALWLDPNKTSPYEFYQYWRNVEDESVKTVLQMLTFFPDEKIEELANLKDEKINEAKKILAFEITKLIHGEEEAKKAEEASNALFSGKGSLDNMPTVTLVKCNIAPSKGQARTLITQGGITLNDEKITDTNYSLSEKDFENDYAILKKGKKVFYKLV